MVKNSSGSLPVESVKCIPCIKLGNLEHSSLMFVVTNGLRLFGQSRVISLPLCCHLPHGALQQLGPTEHCLPHSIPTSPRTARVAQRVGKLQMIQVASQALQYLPSSLIYDLKVHQAEGLTELTVFAFESLRAGACVTPDAVSTLPLILARVALTLVTVCNEKIWKLRLKASSRMTPAACGHCPCTHFADSLSILLLEMNLSYLDFVYFLLGVCGCVIPLSLHHWLGP